jgi:hypothetical protein
VRTCQPCGRAEELRPNQHEDRVTVDDVTVVLNGAINVSHARLCSPCWDGFYEILGQYPRELAQVDRSS